jgi:hypothetical protein
MLYREGRCASGPAEASQAADSEGGSFQQAAKSTGSAGEHIAQALPASTPMLAALCASASTAECRQQPFVFRQASCCAQVEGHRQAAAAAHDAAVAKEQQVKDLAKEGAKADKDRLAHAMHWLWMLVACICQVAAAAACTAHPGCTHSRLRFVERL